jgi:heme exporter protein A
VTLTVDNLHLERGGRTLIEGLSFTVHAGQALILTGPNGTGKTTLLRALAGLFTPTAGTIGLDPLPENDTSVAENCHVIGHQNGLKSTLTAAENLAFWAAFLSLQPATPQLIRDRIAKALASFDLTALADIPAGYLSAGQRRRLGLARLLAAHRPVWLLDEPTVSLDAASTNRFAEIVNAHLIKGGIVVAATHLALGLANARELALTAPIRDTNPRDLSQ